MAYFDNNPSDDDFDGNPGSDENSAAFDRQYNSDGYNEFTNLPEIDERQEIARFERTQNEYRQQGIQNQLREAYKRVQYWPHAGRFIIPKENTFAAHLELVREGNSVDIQFDASTYKYFDKVIAEHANKPQLFNPKHPEYAKYQTLRENLAVLRNDIMGVYMDDGSFDPGDEKYLPRLAQIGAEIGDALNADNRYKKSIFPALDTEIANIEGEGAAYIYEYITKSRQINSSMLGNTWAFMRRLAGMPGNQWQLPPIETTAFSQHALGALPPADELAHVSAHELRQRAAEQAEELRMILDPGDTHAIRDVRTPERREAVKHGKVIINWLRNIKFTDISLEDMIDTSRPGGPSAEALQADKDAMALMVHAYRNVVQTAARDHAELADRPAIQAANRIADIVEHSMELMAKLENPDSQAETVDIGATPKDFDTLSKETVARLMETLKEGLAEAVEQIELDQHDADIAQEAFAQNQVEEALAMQRSYNAKRARKQKGPTQQQKVDQALRADDRAADQGAYSDNESENAVRVARQKAKQLSGSSQQTMAKKNSDSGANSDKRRGQAQDEGEDISMEERIAQASALGQDTSTHNAMSKIDKKQLENLGKVIMAKNLQANIAASEVADVKGGGIGTGESFSDKQDRQPKNKPRIG